MLITQAKLIDASEIRSLVLMSGELSKNDMDEQGWQLFVNRNSLESFQAIIENPDYLVLIAVDKNLIAGLLVIQGLEKIDLMFVHPDYQGKGIARQLWGQALESSKNLGKETDFFWVRSSTNAVPVYEKFGFEIKRPKSKKNGISFTYMERGVKT